MSVSAAGMDAFLTKPVDPDALADVLGPACCGVRQKTARKAGGLSPPEPSRRMSRHHRSAPEDAPEYAQGFLFVDLDHRSWLEAPRTGHAAGLLGLLRLKLGLPILPPCFQHSRPGCGWRL